MSDPAAPSTFKYDAFVSYSRRDSEFARRLEQALSAYMPPRDLPVPRRRLRVFRDESDFQGTDYHASLDRNLRDAANLIVICSPSSAQSAYVGDEIRRFAKYRDKDHIIPILLSGIPNNEVKTESADQRAFPSELVELLPIPLANDYRGFDARSDKPHKGRFTQAWFKTLADLYVDHGVDRSQIEQREQKRRLRRLQIWISVASAVGVALVALTIWALLSRNEATRQRDLARARQYETEARLAFDESRDGLVKATLLAAASLGSSVTPEGHGSLMRALNVLPPAPAWRHDAREERQTTMMRAAFSPDGAMLAVAEPNGVVHLLDARTGQAVRTIDGIRSGNPRRSGLAFSPDGTSLVIGCEHHACVVDPGTGQVRLRIPQPADGPRHGAMVWAASFSPDGRALATSSYRSNEVLIYDTATWRVTDRIAHPSDTVRAVAFSPDGKALATVVAADDHLRLWRPGAYGQPFAEARVGGPWIAFGDKGDRLATSTGELWRVPSSEGALERVSAAQVRGDVVLAVPDRDGCFVIGGTAAVSMLCGEPLREALRFPLVSAGGIAVTPDGRGLAIRDERAVALWPLERGGTVARLAVGSPITGLVPGPKGDWLAAGAEDGSVAVFDAATWAESRRLKLSGAVAEMRASADGRWLVAPAGAAVHVIDALAWRERDRKSLDAGDRLAWAAVDPENRWVVSSGEREKPGSLPSRWVSILDFRDLREQVWAEHDGPIDAVRISKDGKSLATVTAPQFTRGLGLIRPTRTRVWDLGTGKEIAWEYDEQGDLARNSQWSLPRDESRRKVPRVWGRSELIPGTVTWRPLFVDAPSGQWRSGDGQWTADSDSLKESRTGRVVSLLPHEGGVKTLAFVPAGAARWVVTGGRDGTVRVWPLTVPDMTAEACARLRPSLERTGSAKYLEDLARTLGQAIQPCPDPR